MTNKQLGQRSFWVTVATLVVTSIIGLGAWFWPRSSPSTLVSSSDQSEGITAATVYSTSSQVINQSEVVDLKGATVEIVKNISGDKVSGDKVMGDKIIHNNYSLESSSRLLTSEQINSLTSRISLIPAAKVRFISKIFDPESENFARQISKAFLQTKWQIAEPAVKTLLEDFEGQATVFASEAMQNQAYLICEALTAAQIPCGPQNIPGSKIGLSQYNEDTIYLVVDSQF